MIKKCIRCGKEFDAVFEREKACSLKCKAEIAKFNRKNRAPRQRRQREATK